MKFRNLKPAQPAAPSQPRTRKRVVFVCIGNSCRSQMAEGFANTLGADVMRAASAGLSPASLVAPLTKAVMAEKGIDLAQHFPKGLSELDLRSADLVVNMSGVTLRNVPAPVEDWEVFDPIGSPEEDYIRVRDNIEKRVLQLVARLRE